MRSTSSVEVTTGERAGARSRARSGPGSALAGVARPVRAVAVVASADPSPRSGSDHAGARGRPALVGDRLLAVGWVQVAITVAGRGHADRGHGRPTAACRPSQRTGARRRCEVVIVSPNSSSNTPSSRRSSSSSTRSEPDARLSQCTHRRAPPSAFEHAPRRAGTRGLTELAANAGKLQNDSRVISGVSTQATGAVYGSLAMRFPDGHVSRRNQLLALASPLMPADSSVAVGYLALTAAAIPASSANARSGSQPSGATAISPRSAQRLSARDTLPAPGRGRRRRRRGRGTAPPRLGSPSILT